MIRRDSFGECSTPEQDTDLDADIEERCYSTPTRKTKPKQKGCSSVSSISSIPRWAALEELERERSRVSTNKDRVRAITQKLSKLQQGIEADKTRTRYSLQNRLKQIENKVIGRENSLDEKFNDIGNQLEHLLEGLGQERLARELLDERKTKEVELMTKQVELGMSNFKEERKSVDQKHEERLSQLSEEIATERVLRVQSEEKFGIQLGDQVALLVEQVQNEREKTDKLAETVMLLQKELEVTKNIVEQERKSKQDLEAHLVQMMEDLCARVQNELINERSDRESMEETLLKLIEETCARVENGLAVE